MSEEFFHGSRASIRYDCTVLGLLGFVPCAATGLVSALFAFLILSIGSFVAAAGPLLLTYDPIGQAIVRLAILVGLCFLLTPFFLTIHRFLLLGEEATRYDFKPSSPRFQLFFGWLAVSVVLVSFPSLLVALMEAKDPLNYFSRPSTGFDFTIATAAVLPRW